MEVAQESLSPHQTSLPQVNVTDVARPYVSIFRTTGNVIRTERDRAMPRETSYSEMRYRESCQSPTYLATSISSNRIGNLDIFSPIHPSIARRVSNAEPFDASIHEFLAINEHRTSYFNGVIGVETIFPEVANINLHKMVNSVSNSVFRKTPKFVDLRLSTTHTADKLKSVFAPAAIAGGLTDKSYILTSMHSIAEVTADRLSEAKVYSD